MNFDPLRRLQSKWSVALVAAAALVLSSCGGGGASSSPSTTGSLQLLPSTSSLYAGVPYTFNITGGRPPYLVTSSEQTLIALNETISGNTFDVVPRNPGVVDVGLDPNEVPRRTVNIQVRDAIGNSISNSYNVLQNFFTGYSEGYTSTCATASGGTAAQACSGTDTLITLIPVSNGTLYGNREFQLDKVRGDYQFVVEDPNVTPQLVNQIRVRTDQVGRAFVRARVVNGAPTQLASYKITDISTGVTTNAVFMIVQQAPVDAISVLPVNLTFTGATTTRCGDGTADVNVFGGTPPYTITGSGGVAVSPTTLATSGKFQVTVGVNSPPCPTNAAVTVTDSKGAVVQVPISITAGSTSIALSAAPDTIASLDCNTSVNVTVVGGNGGLSATSQHPRITATISGNTLVLKRLIGDLTNYPTSGTATVTDGSSIVTITITATPANCP